MWSRSGQRQHNRATKRKGNKIKPSLQQQPVKMLFVTEGARRAVNKEAEEADEDPHSEVVVRPTLRQIPFRSLSLIKLPMLPKHDGTFFLTSTYRQHWWKRAKGERNVSYCWFSFFVIHRQIASQQQIWHSWKLILRKAQQMARASAGNLLSLIVSGTMILGWEWRDCHHQIRLLELSGETPSHKFFEFNLLNPYRSAVHSTMVEEYDTVTQRR